MSQFQAQPLRKGTLQRLLQNHSPFQQADSDTYRLAEANAVLVQTQTETAVINAGEASPYAWFLVEGGATLVPHADPQDTRKISHTDAEARFPLANLRPAQYTVIPDLQAKLVRLEQSFVRRLSQQPRPARFIGGSEVGGGSWQSHRFALEVVRMRNEGGFKLPALPGISARISQAMQDPDFAISDLAKLISADPVIAAELLKLSNSAMFRGAGSCETVQAAIVRLGVAQSQTLVLSLAAKALFSSRLDWVRARLSQMWRHAVEIGAYASILAKLGSHFDVSKGLLMGLLHEIGAVPILAIAGDYKELAETPGVLDAVLANHVPALSSQILQTWGLDSFADGALHQENWLYEHDEVANYTDLVIVAHLHALIKARRFTDLPRIADTPAFGKLCEQGFSTSASVQVLEEAQQELQELRALLT